MGNQEHKRLGCLSGYFLYVLLYVVYLILTFFILRLVSPGLESESSLSSILAFCAIASILTVVIIKSRKRLIELIRRE